MKYQKMQVGHVSGRGEEDNASRVGRAAACASIDQVAPKAPKSLVHLHR